MIEIEVYFIPLSEFCVQVLLKVGALDFFLPQSLTLYNNVTRLGNSVFMPV